MSTSHRDLCIITARWLLAQSWCGLVCWEIAWRRGVADVIGVTTKKSKEPRIVVIEVKRTRADLLQDLRAQKMLKYEQGTSHNYLSATKEALGSGTDEEVLADLLAKGLPKHWGVLEISSDNNIRCIRGARARKRPTKTSLDATIRKIAISYCYRVLGGTFIET